MRSLIPGFLVAIVLGCGGSAPSVTTSRPGPQGPPAGQPPRILRVGGFEIGAERLPAVSTDGHLVAFAHVDEDGGRGNPNYKVVIQDVDRDVPVKELVILTVTESERDPDGPTLAARIEEANAYLASGAWVPLSEIALVIPGGGELATTAASGPIRVAYNEPRVTATLDGEVVVDRRVPEWSARPAKMCPTCAEKCENPAGLSGAWTAPAPRVLVLRVSYKGTDTCWEPDSREHVLRMAR